MASYRHECAAGVALFVSLIVIGPCIGSIFSDAIGPWWAVIPGCVAAVAAFYAFTYSIAPDGP